MNTGKICISICCRTSDHALDAIQNASAGADLIELRLDCLEPSEVDPLLTRLPGSNSYLITFRPRENGGMSDADKIERLRFWSYVLAKLHGYDFFVDHEGDIDFPLKLDPDRTIISMHDFDGRVTDLPLAFDVLSELTGKTIKIAVSVEDAADAVPVWDLLDRAKRNDRQVIPIAMGEAGKWTRILGLAHGAPITYASPGSGRETAPGQITADDLRDVYRVKQLDTDTVVYGLIAGNTSYSLSPFMHNAALAETGLNAVFVPLQVKDVDRFVSHMVRRETREVELDFGGFAVTNPHKQAIMRHLDHVDDTARAIGSVNTVTIDDERLIGSNTDADGFIQPLLNSVGDLRSARAAVAGNGGAARACIFSLLRAGADVTILARDHSRAASLSNEFSVPVEQLADGSLRSNAFDILVNATPLGTRGEHEQASVATADELRGVKLVYDLVYNPRETRLIREAKQAGAKTLGGLDMLIAQGAKQFEIWTGREAPIGVMRAAVEKRLV